MGSNAGGASVGQDDTFWGSAWARQVIAGNYLAGGSFKGFASHVSRTTWTTDTGDSSNPPGSVASYIGVLVSTNIGIEANVINGNVKEIVVLRVDNPAGYLPDPGHTATGMLVAIVQ